MGLFTRWRPARVRASAGQRSRSNGEARAAREHLEGFIRSRAGVEAFVEPATTVLPPTVVLVASSGEWTRRRVPSAAAVRDLGIPVYDARLVGYPQRMREWNERVKRGEAPPP